MKPILILASILGLGGIALAQLPQSEQPVLNLLRSTPRAHFTAKGPPVVVNREILAFTATWCGPCKQQHAVWHALQRKGYVVKYIDIDKSQLDEKYGVRMVPTTICLVNGQEVGREVGYTSAARIEGHFKRIPKQNLRL